MDRAEIFFDDLFGKDPAVERLLSPSREELNSLEDAITEFRKNFENNPSDHLIVFQYASLLISHSRESYINEGMMYMETLVHVEWEKRWGGLTHTELAEKERRSSENSLSFSESNDVLQGTVGVSASAPRVDGGNGHNGKLLDSKDETIATLAVQYYFLSIGWVKLRDFDKALTCVKQMLHLEPNHRQGLALKRHIEAVTRQTIAVTGAAGFGVVAAILAEEGLIRLGPIDCALLLPPFSFAPLMFRRIAALLGGNIGRRPGAAPRAPKSTGAAPRGGPLAKRLVPQTPRRGISQAKNLSAARANTAKTVVKSPQAITPSKKSRSNQKAAVNTELQKKTLKPERRSQTNKVPTMKDVKVKSQEKNTNSRKRPHAHTVQKIKYNKRVAAIAKLWRLGKKKSSRSNGKPNTSK